MPRQIWNEGRVVGYSAYEVYVKHALSVDPDHEPATEKEWLASMMAMGSSMLLRIGVDPVGLAYDGLHYRDIQFPEDSRLCAANTIMASFFDGEGYVGTVSPSDDLTGWATKVTSYGSLINNNSTSYPSGTIDTDGTIPPTGIKEITNTTIVPRIKEYMKIVDGIIIQPGTWTDNPNTPPQKDFKPTLSKYPRLRIAFSERITTPFFLLLTGFTNRTVVDGTTGFDTAVNTLSPSDGDFLGPWAFPWSAKVIFSVPSSFINYFMNNNYTRQLKTGTSEISVKSDTIIDLKQNHNSDLSSIYFSNEDTDSTLPAKVVDINILGDDAAVFATYMHSDNDVKLPPALYASLVNSEGDTKFEPVDTVAPGSLHLYRGDTASESSITITKAKTLEANAKGATAFMRDEGSDEDSKSSASYVVYELNQIDQVVPVSDDYNVSIWGALSITEPIPPYFCMQHNLHDPDDWFNMWVIASWRIFGNVSKEFEKVFALSPTQIDAILNTRTGDTHDSVNSSMYEQVKNKKDYYYIVSGPRKGAGGHGGAHYWNIIPVRKIDGHIDVVYKQYYESDNNSYTGSDGRSHNVVELIQPNSINTTNASINNYKYVGGYWNGEGPSDNPTLYDVMPEDVQKNSFIQDKDRKAPKSSGSWVDDYKNVTLQALANSTGIDISHVAQEFRSLSLLEIVNKARLYKLGNGEKITYTSDGKTYEGRHKDILCIPFASNIKVSNNTVDFDSFTEDCVLTANITAVTENRTTLLPLPSIYQRTDGPLAAVGVSGNNQTFSLSVADSYGNMYDLYGLSDDMKCDEFRDNKLHWSDLVDCLASGKSIDLLGPVLRGIVNSCPSSDDKLTEGNYIINITKNSSGKFDVKLVKQ
jgi:hypothetical protein